MEIIEMRKKLGLTQAEFGRKYKIPSRTVRNIESSGKNNPLLKMLLDNLDPPCYLEKKAT